MSGNLSTEVFLAQVMASQSRALSKAAARVAGDAIEWPGDGSALGLSGHVLARLAEAFAEISQEHADAAQKIAAASQEEGGGGKRQ